MGKGKMGRGKDEERGGGGGWGEGCVLALFKYQCTCQYTLPMVPADSTEGTHGPMTTSTSLPVVSAFDAQMPDSGDEDNNSYTVTGTEQVVIHFDEPDGSTLQRKNSVSRGVEWEEGWRGRKSWRGRRRGDGGGEGDRGGEGEGG